MKVTGHRIELLLGKGSHLLLRELTHAESWRIKRFLRFLQNPKTKSKVFLLETFGMLMMSTANKLQVQGSGSYCTGMKRVQKWN